MHFPQWVLSSLFTTLRRKKVKLQNSASIVISHTPFSRIRYVICLLSLSSHSSAPQSRFLHQSCRKRGTRPAESGFCSFPNLQVLTLYIIVSPRILKVLTVQRSNFTSLIVCYLLSLLPFWYFLLFQFISLPSFFPSFLFSYLYLPIFLSYYFFFFNYHLQKLISADST